MINKILLTPLTILLYLIPILLQGQSIIKVTKNDFPKKVKLSGQPILTNDYHHHHHIHVIDDFLLTLTNSGEYNYHVFDKKSEKYLGPIGRKGDGPKEWEIPLTTLGQYEKKDGEIFLWYFDFLRGYLQLMNFSKTVTSKSIDPIIERRLKFNMRVFPYFQLLMGDNRKAYATSWIYEANRGRIKSLDLDSKVIKKSKLFPEISNDSHLPSEVINSLYSASFDKHPKENLFIQATFIFNRIDIFDYELNVLRSIVDGENWQNNYYDGREIDPSSNFIRPRINGYDGISVSEKYIFALEAKKNVGTDQEIENESFIRVYDWFGKPIVYLEITHDLSSIDFDKESRSLYATDYNHQLVLKIDLSNVIK